jgi:hypothetical protein
LHIRLHTKAPAKNYARAGDENADGGHKESVLRRELQNLLGKKSENPISKQKLKYICFTVTRAKRLL